MTDQPTPPTEAAFFTTIRRWGIVRGDSRLLGGVVSGLAHRLGWSAVGWTRVGVVALALLLNGIVLLAYAAAWALLPDREGRIIAQDFGRGTPNVGALIMIGVIGVLGLSGLGDGGGPWVSVPWTFDWPWDGGWPAAGVARAAAIVAAIAVPLAIIGGVIALIVVLSRRDQGGPDGTRPAPDGSGDGAAPVYAAPPAWAAERQRERAMAGATASSPVPPAAASSAAPSAPPYSAPTAYTPPPRVPRVPGPGAPFGLLTLAWLLLSAAGAAWAAWQDVLTVHPLIAWFALFFTGLGVILVLVALSGRRLGFLAFLSAVLLIPAAIMTAQADTVVDGWSDRWLPSLQILDDGDGAVRIQLGDETVWVNENGDITSGDPGRVTETAAAAPRQDFDALAAFEDDYASVTLPGGCFPLEELPADEGQSRGLISHVELDQDTSATVAASLTTVRVAAGTGLEVIPGAGQSATVYWPDRSIGCDVWDGEQLALGAQTPTLTLMTDNPELYTAIIIEEVAS